jgi:hypothetical protein
VEDDYARCPHSRAFAIWTQITFLSAVARSAGVRQWYHYRDGHEQMNVIRQHFQRQQFPLLFATDLLQDRAGGCFHGTSKYGAPVFGEPDEVVLDLVDGITRAVPGGVLRTLSIAGRVPKAEDIAIRLEHVMDFPNLVHLSHGT